MPVSKYNDTKNVLELKRFSSSRSKIIKILCTLEASHCWIQFFKFICVIFLRKHPKNSFRKKVSHYRWICGGYSKFKQYRTLSSSDKTQCINVGRYLKASLSLSFEIYSSIDLITIILVSRRSFFLLVHIYIAYINELGRWLIGSSSSLLCFGIGITMTVLYNLGNSYQFQMF